MLSPKLRQDIYELWTMFWSSGMTNPLTAVEQITYLLFLKRLEALDVTRTRGGKRSIYGRREHCELVHHPEDHIGVDPLDIPAGVDETTYCEGHGTCRWSYIVRVLSESDDPAISIKPHDHLSQYVFPWMRVLETTLKATGNGDTKNNGLEATAERMEDAYFQLPREKTATLQKAIRTIDRLFSRVDASDDLMGDIFEFLLSEIQSSGKNGQFRTPRHIIRFMVNLVDPDWMESIADPAAGTGGFLLNTIQHVLQRYTNQNSALMEWDGTPHRLDGAGIPLQREAPYDFYPSSQLFTAYDNDRTMVRIGWMNLILHGLEDPHMFLQDTLGKNFTEADKYDVVLANPPFTGTIDKNDFSPRFRDLPTNKSELLFVFLILDLLKVGGRAAVIVPEGVLFGSTNAHKELRRRLVLDNLLEGVVSLPAGVFQPYTGVKTSILVFRKIDEHCKPGMQPHTQQIWFYEVGADGYTLDAKRNPKPTPNDLWDALEKWKKKGNEDTNYYRPTIYTVRWRVVDEKTMQIFPELASEEHQVRGIHELFRELNADPEEAKKQVVEQQRLRIQQIYQTCLGGFEGSLMVYPRPQKATRAMLDDVVRELNGLFDDAAKERLERGKGLPEYGRKALEPVLAEIRRPLEEDIRERVERIIEETTANLEERFMGESTKIKQLEIKQIRSAWEKDIHSIVREFAKLDGYNVQLRSWSIERTTDLAESKNWVRPVRIFAQTDTWVSSNGLLRGSYNEQGQVRSEFIADRRIYNADGTVKEEYLDEDCIEAKDFNLSAGRYKPFSLKTIEYDPPEQIIRELQVLEEQIQDGLVSLLAVVEGRE